ncbi:uncharacterized protein LOC116248413 [Nymphaea colorata]|nr:uncharacterized protein LOC116248413 [Nymphaea colorata]XP_031477047.1 uncharacterized protein LOC116248413 [Nymphaea colorata]
MAMDGGEPKFLPQWLKGTSGAGRSSASPSSHGSVASQANREIAGGSFLPRNKCGQSKTAYLNPLVDDVLKNSTGRLTAKKSWKEGLKNVDQQDGLHKQREFSNPRDYGSFRRSSSAWACFDGGKDREHKSDNSWEKSHRDRARDAQMNFSSCDSKAYDISKQLPTSPLSGSSESSTFLRRSRSFLSEIGSDDGSEKIIADNGNSGFNRTSSGVLPNKMQKASFDKDFPLLGASMKNGTAASSPRDGLLSTQSRLMQPGKNISSKHDNIMGSSCSYSQFDVPSSIKPDWKSALAEPPSFTSAGPLETKINHSGLMQHAVPNMLGSLIQKSGQERSPLLQVEPYKEEEIALKQSLQLIPAIPPKPKGLHALGFSDRAKTKVPLHVNTSNANQAATPSHSNMLKHSKSAQGGGKLLILKTAKSVPIASDKSLNSEILETLNGFKSSQTCASDKHVNTSNVDREHMQQSSGSRMSSASSLLLESARSKESIHSLAEPKRNTRQSIKDRNDFFNSLRQKGKNENTNSSMAVCEAHPTMPEECNDNLTTERKKEEILEDIMLTETVNREDNKVDDHSILVETSTTVSGRCESRSFCVKVSSEEEEAAFLRRLGWDESDGAVEALTEEEINSFILQHMNAVLSKNMLRGKSAWKLSALMMHAGNMGSVSSH